MRCFVLIRLSLTLRVPWFALFLDYRFHDSLCAFPIQDRTDSSILSPISSILLSSPIMSSNNQTSLSTNFSKRTFHQTAFTWTIGNFSLDWSIHQKWSTDFDDGKRGHYRLYLEKSDNAYLRLTLHPQLGVSTQANFIVSLIDSKGEKVYLYGKKNCLFEDNQNYINLFMLCRPL